MSWRVIRLTSKDVWTNLACEERLFATLPDSARALLFYVNSPCVVVGRTQNPLFEADVDLARKDGAAVARRRSGGGTVVHDSGNLNICFMAPRERHCPKTNSQLVAEALRESLGVFVEASKRSDLFLNEKKVSGSAFRLTKDRAYHHCTLLLNSNLDRLRALLRSPLAPCLRVSGSASVRSPVCNIGDHGPVSIDTVVHAIARCYATHHGDSWTGDAHVESMTMDDVDQECGSVLQERALLSSPEWVFGDSPRFTFLYAEPGTLPETLAIHVSKGGNVKSVHWITPARVEAVTHVPAVEIGRADHTLIKALEGVKFEKTALAGVAESVKDPHVRELIRKIATRLPELGYGRGMEAWLLGAVTETT